MLRKLFCPVPVALRRAALQATLLALGENGTRWLTAATCGGSRMSMRAPSRRAAGTGPWSFGLEPAEAVSPHAGDCPWCEEGEGSRDGLGPAGERALIGPDPFPLS